MLRELLAVVEGSDRALLYKFTGITSDLNSNLLALGLASILLSLAAHAGPLAGAGPVAPARGELSGGNGASPVILAT